MSALPEAPLSPCIHGSEGDSLSLSARAQVSLRSGPSRLCLQRYLWVPRQDGKTQQDLQSRGRRKPHPPAGEALPSGASTQLRPSLLSCNFSGGAASPLQGLAGPVAAPASAAASLEKLSPQRWPLDSMKGLPIASQKRVTRPWCSRNEIPSQPKVGHAHAGSSMGWVTLRPNAMLQRPCAACLVLAQQADT